MALLDWYLHQILQKQCQMAKLTKFNQFIGTQDYRERKKQDSLSWKDVKDSTSFMWGIFIYLCHKATYVNPCENCWERKQFHQKSTVNSVSLFTTRICNTIVA